MAQARNIRSSHVAAVVVPRGKLAERMKAVEKSTAVKLTSIASMAAGFLGAPGLMASHWLGMVKNGMIADGQKKELVKEYGAQIGAIVGKQANKVDVSDLEMAAKQHPDAFGNLLRKVETDRKNANRASLFATGGAFAAGSAAAGLGLLPGTSGVANMIAHGATKLVVDGGGAVAGGAVSSAFDKNMLHVTDVMARIEQRRERNQSVRPVDVVLLRMAQNEAWQRAYKKKTGRDFYKLTVEQQESVALHSSTDVELQQALQTANKVNVGLMPQEELIVASVAANDSPMEANDNGWQKQVGGGQAAGRGSFRDRELTREQARAMAANDVQPEGRIA